MLGALRDRHVTGLGENRSPKEDHMKAHDDYQVDDRAFLLGLDRLYREAMQQHEGFELLGCARELAATLRITPRPVPIEGYYATNPQLTEYFLLLRALQQVGESRVPEVRGLLSYQRLCQVLSSPIFGRAEHEDTLLPIGNDPLSRALRATAPSWTIPTLTAAAHAVAVKTGDYSLVGLAALAWDPVALVALRESVVLYEGVMLGSTEPLRIGWAVSPELAERGARFIAAFRALFGTALPAPVGDNADVYFGSYIKADPVGRRARLGCPAQTEPGPHYQWVIERASPHGMGRRRLLQAGGSPGH